jgi:hypothetical protein
MSQEDTALEILRALPGFNGLKFNPLPLVKVVNALVRAGPEQSCPILDTYSREPQERTAIQGENALLVARALFVVDAAARLPRVELGRPDVDEPADGVRFPRWPLHLEDDLPLLLVGGYLIGGEGRPVSEQLEWYKTHAAIRLRPLTPPPHPLRVADQFLQSERWKQLATQDWHEGMIRLQAWRAVSGIVPLRREDEQLMLSGDRAQRLDRWQQAIDSVTSSHVGWDANADEYRSAK